MDGDKTEKLFLPFFDGTNYNAWRYRMLSLLEEREFLECIEANVADVPALKDEEGDDAAKQLEKARLRERRTKRDRSCKNLIISRINDDQLEHVQDKTTPKDIWDALEHIFQRKSLARRMYLKKEILTLALGNTSLQQHFLTFDKLVRQYRATGADMDELDAICHLLLTLNASPKYAAVVTSLETQPEEQLSLEFVKCRLLDEETKQKSVQIVIPKKEETAFVGAKAQQQKPKQKKKLRCYNCKEEGHKMSDCPQKKKKEVKASANMAEEQSAVCFAGLSRGESVPEQPVTWYIDSGCSDHLANDKSLFVELEPLKCPVEIAIAKNDECIVAKHSGKVKVISKVNNKDLLCTIENVLFVPELRCNLFSVMRVDDAGMRVTYAEGEVAIYRGSELVASGKRDGKLYRLNFVRARVGENKSMLTCGLVPKNVQLWHRRFGHLNAKSLDQLIRRDMVSGLKLNGGQNGKELVTCEACVLGKQTRKPFAVREGKRSSRVLELIHSDVCGPISPDGLDGAKYFVTFIDDWSHFVVVYLVEAKSEVFRYFKMYEAMATAKFGKKVCRLRCDNGGEYRSNEFEQFCQEKGIQVEWTAPYTPEMNGTSERFNRTLVEKSRAMLEDSRVDKKFWGQAIQTAAYLTNRSPSSALPPDVTPYEQWEGKKPDVSKLRAFGCPVYAHVPKELRKKLDPKAWKGIFLGYTRGGYRIYNPELQRIVHTRDVDFLELEKPEHKAKWNDADVALLPSPEVDEISIAADDEQEPEESQVETDEEYESFQEESEGEPHEEEPNVENPPEPGPSGGRPQRPRNPPDWHKDYQVEYAAFALNATSYVDDVPSSLAEARKRSDWLNWKAAVDDEMKSLTKNGTWTLAKLPDGRAPVSCKWVFAVKRGLDGDRVRYKARLVARGFSQRKGFDYGETYSPVAKLDTLRTVLAVANREKLVVHQMDVRTAFLNGTLEEEIFMTQPEGFEEGTDLVCRLKKSLYGLKQASRAWNERFNNFVVDRLKFERSLNDQCLYTRKDERQTLIIVLYVDDIVIAGTTLKAVETIKRCFFNEFDMTDVGEIKCFLGMQVERNREEGVMRISQKQYMESLLRRFGMDDCKPVSTPIESRLKLHKGTEEERTSQPYRELIGCLTYACLTTRPDLAAAVNFLSQYQSCPNEAHWKHLKRILRYIKGTLDVGLVYRKNLEAPTVEVFADADWANDVLDRRSVSGGIFKVFGSTVAWITRKQQTVSLSSTEAELTALCAAVCHELWLGRLLQDLGFKPEEPVRVHEDNQSTIRVAEEAKDFGRLKHVDVKIHFIRDLIKQKRIKLEFIPSANQQADMMTKGLPVAAFRKQCSAIGLERCSG